MNNWISLEERQVARNFVHRLDSSDRALVRKREVLLLMSAPQYLHFVQPDYLGMMIGAMDRNKKVFDDLLKPEPEQKNKPNPDALNNQDKKAFPKKISTKSKKNGGKNHG